MMIYDLRTMDGIKDLVDLARIGQESIKLMIEYSDDWDDEFFETTEIESMSDDEYSEFVERFTDYSNTISLFFYSFNYYNDERDTTDWIDTLNDDSIVLVYQDESGYIKLIESEKSIRNYLQVEREKIELVLEALDMVVKND